MRLEVGGSVRVSEEDSGRGNSPTSPRVANVFPRGHRVESRQGSGEVVRRYGVPRGPLGNSGEIKKDGDPHKPSVSKDTGLRGVSELFVEIQCPM